MLARQLVNQRPRDAVDTAPERRQARLPAFRRLPADQEHARRDDPGDPGILGIVGTDPALAAVMSLGEIGDDLTAFRHLERGQELRGRIALGVLHLAGL